MSAREGIGVAVGTPGRVYERSADVPSNPTSFEIFCLDEAGGMLSRGFKNQMCEVFQLLPQDTQDVFLPATMPTDVLGVIKKLMRDPVRILTNRDD
ncbi:translation initiation factor eIF4A [Marasmius crinis-equi]|uniref:RNA helicase n=1 Tax=Marasmius crinis-equi TaxID=585013 RepID=A0ABR3FRQ0_9AGAR